MKKILLIEDRVERQKLFVDKTNIDLSKYSVVLDNFVNEDYDELELQILNNNFNFDKYDYIISHKSAFGSKNNEALSRLRDYCKKYQKTLVLFSGGISANYYDNSELEILELNSKVFYSQNLKLFLDTIQDNNENPLMLCYGEFWQQNIIANIVEKINLVFLRLDTKTISKTDFETFTDIEKLANIDFDFYQMHINNNQINIEEIVKLRDSLYSYFEYTQNNSKNIQNTILIDNDNTEDELFDNRIKFTSNINDIDKYISENIIENLRNKEFDVIYIKDNLSSNYLELYGLRVAYHIRLSKELEGKRFVPIFIISDFSSDILNQFEPMANILFTKNIYLIENSVEAIKKAQKMNVENLTFEEFREDFFDKVKVEQPKDYLTHHSIANEWSMYRWAEYLDVNTPDIEKIRDDISSMLYFKYLQAMFPIKRNLFARHKQHLDGSGKVLYIDDEWEKGWKSIFDHIFKENESCHLETVEEIYKDKSQEEIITFIMAKVVSVNPDVVILDMRLHENDFLENVNLADFTGIQVFNKIKEINPGIQVVVFTASNNSLLLDELYSYDSSILGYIKKEHPKNYNLTTQGNINKLIRLVNTGLDEKYLKDIFITNNKIINILNIDIDNPDNNLEIFEKYNIQSNRYLPQVKLINKETRYVFNTLNSNTLNKYAYAMLSITRSLEAITSIFIKERQFDNLFWDKEEFLSRKFEDKITNLMKKLGYMENVINLNPLITRRNQYVHFNSAYEEVTKEEITPWFYVLLEVIKTIENPPSYTPYTP